MSSDEESINNGPEISDNEQQNNEIFEISEDLQDYEPTEEVEKDETAEGEGGGESKDGEKKTVKPKRVIRNPQPKLNAETLKGPRGIAALENYFQHVEFKGKGKEQQDLNVIMKTYEYWCHRLFPKFPFDTCIERLEKLGYKKAVQTHIKRIRFDLLVEDKPILDDSDDETNVEGFIDIENDKINQQQNQQFDQLLNSSVPASVTPPVELTEEQLQRIRLNKERAERLKQDRLRKIRDKAEERLQLSSQLPGTSGLQSKTKLQSSQGDVNSQEDYTLGGESGKNIQDILHPAEDGETLFDLESAVKGKTSITGTSIKKKSKKCINVFNTDSESENENIEDHISKRDVALSNKRISNVSESSDIDQISSVSGFAQKKRNGQNTIFGSDDDQCYNEKGKNHSEETKDSNNKNIDDRKSVRKIKPSTLLDTDESEQEVEQISQFSKENIVAKKSTERSNLDINHTDQEMDTNQEYLYDVNTDNFSDGNDLNKDSINANSSGDKSSSLHILSPFKNNHVSTNDSVVVVPNVVEVTADLTSDIEPMEIFKDKVN